MSSTVYVYYRVDPDLVSQARAAIEALVTLVSSAADTAGRLLRRDNDPHTWLEVYEPVHDFDKFHIALTAGVERLGVEKYLQVGSVRVLERFVSVASIRPCR